MATRSPDINVMCSAATRAARRLMRDYGELDALQASPKGTASFLAESVRRTTDNLVYELGRARPDFSIDIAGQGTVQRPHDRSPRWVIDPINGVENFSRALPMFAMSMAVVMGVEPVAGVVYDPLRDEMFWAERGSGAFMNDGRLRVNDRRPAKDMIVNIEPAGAPAPEPSETEPTALILPTAPMAWRSLGSPALSLAYVASSRLDGVWVKGADSRGMLAGITLVREAGGQIDFMGNPDPLSSESLLAGNGTVHKQLSGALAAKTDEQTSG